MKKYDAVYLSVGLHKPYKIGLPGEEKTIPAIEFLKNVKLKRKVKIGREVVVIGGKCCYGCCKDLHKTSEYAIQK